MSEKTIVVQGAMCKCQFGQAPDKLKVLSHKKHYANDKNGFDKLIATTLETGAATLQANTFGNCKKLNNNPCKPMITEWQGYYEKITLSNGGHILVEDSKAVCAIAGTACIEITHHGQIAEPNQQNVDNANKDVHRQLNSMVNLEEMLLPKRKHTGYKD